MVKITSKWEKLSFFVEMPGWKRWGVVGLIGDTLTGSLNDFNMDNYLYIG